MTGRRRRAVAVATASCGLLVASPILAVVFDRPFEGAWVWKLVPAAAFVAVGALLTVKRPEHRLGWVVAAVGALHALLLVTQSVPTDRDPLWVALGLLSIPAWMLGAAVPATFLLLLFPDGRLPSDRWRPVAWATAIGVALLVVSEVLAPFEESGIGLAGPNPLTPPGAEGALEAVFLVGALVTLAGVASSVVSLVVRFRRSHGLERQQVKWVALAGVVGFAIYAASDVIERLPLATGDVTFAVAVGLLPTAVAFAVLRYRLYDIDRVVSRTVSYLLVSVVLAAAYALVVLVPTALVGSGEGAPDVAVAAGTLVAAALFRPVRAAIQGAVDRRFNRDRYAAEAVLARFGARLRDEVDLSAVTEELRGAVRGSLQPANVSLWLAGSEATP